MAFQVNAFQATAFQMISNSYGKVIRRWIVDEPEVKKAIEEYEEALETLKEVEAKVPQEQLQAITEEFLSEEGRLDIEHMTKLMQEAEARHEFEEAIRLIKQIKKDMLKILALLLLADEATVI